MYLIDDIEFSLIQSHALFFCFWNGFDVVGFSKKTQCDLLFPLFTQCSRIAVLREPCAVANGLCIFLRRPAPPAV